MHRRCRRGLVAALCALLPLTALAETGATAEAETEVRRGSITGKIERAKDDSITVLRLGPVPRPNAPRVLIVPGGPDVPVSGEGKQTWSALKRGDLIIVAYEIGETPRATKVLVLPPNAHPVVAAAVGSTPAKKRGRQFTGWIKYKDETRLVLRSPDAPPTKKREGQVREFVRHEGTEVDLLRDSWEALKKGDRVTIEFGKGNPRPANRIHVVLRGGEKPLPPGLAGRLFDPDYDESVKDVDGIGEIPPGTTWEPPSPSASN
jgi:hypothetical protein